MSADLLGSLVGAVLLFAVVSRLHGDSIVYRVVERLLVGVSLGYVVLVVGQSLLWPRLVAPWLQDASVADGGRWNVAWLALGMTLLLHRAGRFAWVARVPLTWAVGTFVGLGMVAAIRGVLVPQLAGAVAPADVGEGTCAQWAWSCGPWATVNHLVALLATVTVLMAFSRMFVANPVVRLGGRLGSGFLMVGLGATFAYAATGRMAVLSAVARDAVAAPALYGVAACLVAGGVWLSRRRDGSPPAA